MTDVLDAPAVVAGLSNSPQFAHARPGELRPWPGLNIRRVFPEAWVRELAVSIASDGVHQPLNVHRTPDGELWIVLGETRWRSATLAEQGCAEIGLEPAGEVWIPVMIKEWTEEKASAAVLIENIQRASLTPIEVAEGYQRMIGRYGWTQARVAEEVLGDRGKQSQIANHLRLLELPDEARELVDTGVVPFTAARDHLLPLLRLPDEQAQAAMGRAVAAIRVVVDAGNKITGPWLAEAAERITVGAQSEMGSVDMFASAGVEIPAPAAAQESAAPVPAAPPVEPQHTPDDDAAALDGGLTRALQPNESWVGRWDQLAERGATDAQITGALVVLAEHYIGQMEVPHAGKYFVRAAGHLPYLQFTSAASGRMVQLTGARFIARVRDVMLIGQPVAVAPDESALAAGDDDLDPPLEVGEGDDGDAPNGDPEAEIAQAASEAEQVDALIREALMSAPGWERWPALMGSGATDEEIIREVGSQVPDGAPAFSSIPTVGSYKLHGTPNPILTVCPAATRRYVHFRDAQLVEAVRRVVGVPPRPGAAPAAAPAAQPSQAPARPAPARSAAPAVSTAPTRATSAAAPASAPAPAPAAPVTVAPPPGATRRAIPEGAGFGSALLAILGDRAASLSVAKLPNGNVAFTCAPRMLRAGETPFLLNVPQEELDAQLLPALDAHFSV